MDLLNKIYAQLAESYRSLSPRARAASAFLAIVVIASFAYLVNERITPQESYLLGGERFSTSQLREIQTALGKAGLEAHVDGQRIKVPRGQESKTMAALAESGALGDFGGYLKKAVNGNSFMLYGPQQEARTKVAVQSELQLVISRMQGIENAFVHIDQETKRGFRETSIVTASVAIQPRGERSLDEATVAAVRSFVASAWAGLKPEAVTVVDLSGPRLFAGTGGQPPAAGTSGNYADWKRRLELDWQDKIGRLLAPIAPGALVTTNVELEGASPQDAALPGGADAAGTQGGAATAQVAKRVTVSVAVPSSHYEQIWRRESPSAAGRPQARPRAGVLAEIELAEKKKIREAILPLLGNKSATADDAQVAITTFHAALPTQPSEPALGERGWGWLQGNWRVVGLAALAAIGLLALRTVVVSSPGAGAKATPPAGDAATASPTSGPHVQLFAPDGAEPAPARTPMGGSLRDELADIVREHPASAVSLLRTWIGTASRTR